MSERSKPRKPPMTHPIPVKIRRSTKLQVERVAREYSQTEANVMRLAIERGLAMVEKIFELPGAR